MNLVDQALRGPLFERSAGLASSDVTLADPAVGTGTFLLGALRHIAANIEKDQGAGTVSCRSRGRRETTVRLRTAIRPVCGRAIAPARGIAHLDKTENHDPPPPDLNLFITDTLGNPFVEEEQLPQIVEAVAKSRRQANRVKRKSRSPSLSATRLTRIRRRDMGDWIEHGGNGRAAPMARWTPQGDASRACAPPQNLYVYFWRWATLKVFGAGRFAATGLPDSDEEGIVCFITVAGFLNGPGFVKMREDLRRTCSDIWVIDCSPEGHQPDVPTRIFQGVQQPVCIVLAARTLGKDETKPADIWFHALPNGRREEKFKALAALSLDAALWIECSMDWPGPFLPDYAGTWADFAPLSSLFESSYAGVKPHRTWPIAPDKESLSSRWDRLRSAPDAKAQEQLFGSDDARGINDVITVDLGPYLVRAIPIAKDKAPVVPPARYAFRSFDRQWIIPDHRLLSRARPKLWALTSDKQVFLTAVEDQRIEPPGPAVTFTGLLPDQHHYNGRGGRVYPLWASADATSSNVSADILQTLATAYGAPVTAEDLFAYVAAVMAHPAFTARFKADLLRPGLRVPVTADKALFDEEVALGREVVWLHCYGERFVDPAAGRPRGPPRLPAADRPTIPAAGAIPGAPASLPETMSYDAAKRRLAIGKGFVENVAPAMRNYEISGKNVLDQWFSYRRRDRTKPQIGDRRPPSPLEKIQPDGWLAEYTEDLLNLLNVLGRLVALEPQQADVLDRIVAGPLSAAGAEESGTTDEEPSQ